MERLKHYRRWLREFRLRLVAKRYRQLQAEYELDPDWPTGKRLVRVEKRYLRLKHDVV